MPRTVQPTSLLDVNYGNPIANGLQIAWVGSLAQFVRVPHLRSVDVTGTPEYSGNIRGKVYRFNATTAALALLSNGSSLPTGPCTVTLHWRKTDATNRGSGAFGYNAEPSPFDARLGAHLPYSDGTVYWDYGGSGGGANRLSVSGLTFGSDIWSFSTGARGMEVWQNGILRASNANNPTRGSLSAAWYLNRHSGTDGDLADCAFLYLHNRQLTSAEIIALYVNPWQLFAPQQMRRIILLPAAGGQSFSYTASGGLQLGGIADVLRKLAYAAAGGLQLGGSAEALRKLAYAATGGIALAGAAPNARGFQTQGSGGLSLGGSADRSRVRAPVAAGGVVFGGSSPVEFISHQEFSYTAQGGMTVSGASSQTRVAARASLGGISLGGVAAVATHESTRTVVASGGLSLGGAAAVQTSSSAQSDEWYIRRRRRRGDW